MEYYFLIWLALMPFTVQPDPAPGLRHSKDWSRNLECERMDAETAGRRYPGRIPATRPRGDYVERSAVVCRERMVRLGLRSDRDEAILSSLDARATELAEAAASLRPDLAAHTWLVEAHYPGAQVAAKLTFATKNALVGQGLAVTDRVPVLGVGDVGVLTRLPPERAYAAACQRYAATGTLREGDALLAVVTRDPRETIVHGGVCAAGRWMWLQ